MSNYCVLDIRTETHIFFLIINHVKGTNRRRYLHEIFDAKTLALGHGISTSRHKNMYQISSLLSSSSVLFILKDTIFRGKKYFLQN
jgi:hypothetical protein